jgi:hypothetical protein
MNLRNLTAMVAAASALTIAVQARADVIFYLTTQEPAPGTIIAQADAVEVDVDLTSSGTGTSTAMVTFTAPTMGPNAGVIDTPVELNVSGNFVATTTIPLAGGTGAGKTCGIGTGNTGSGTCTPGSEDGFGVMDLETSSVSTGSPFTINLSAGTWANAAAVLTPTTLPHGSTYPQGFEAEVSYATQVAGFAAPAPLIGHGLPGILAVAGVLFGAGLVKRGKKRGFFGVPCAG